MHHQTGCQHGHDCLQTALCWASFEAGSEAAGIAPALDVDIWHELVMADCFCRLGQILVFSKIRAALGIMSTIISGGGSLATHLDDFFEVCPHDSI